ncbi:alpha/beta-hydrolase [Poronia punctata]|nr:alpha/beta-hydrolase [Poronia punctata]
MGLFSRKKKSKPQPLPQPPAYGQSKVGKVETRPVPSRPSSGRRDGKSKHYTNTNTNTNSSPAPCHPAGHLPPPPAQGWIHPRPATASPPLAYHGQNQGYYAPIIVNQHYYPSYSPQSPPAPVPAPNTQTNGGGRSCALTQLKLNSTSDLINLPANVINQLVDDGLPRWHTYGSQFLNQTAALYDQISSKFDNVMTLIDRDKLSGHENELFMYQSPSPPIPARPPPTSENAVSRLADPKGGTGRKSRKDTTSKGQTSAVAASLITGGYFSRVDLYINSRLPAELPRFRVTVPTYPLLCLAAQYAERVYEKPRGAEQDAHVEANWKTGTKAMYIKSVPMDKMGTIVFAIRGTATFMDWAVNLNTAPTAPTGFLDDPRNFCHAGFLSVAKKMIAPVAARLRQLLEEDPSRCSHSLIITGHSAGGAIASLLYMHMLATSKAAASELNLLTGCFKGIHCIAFGSPPVSLYPLQTPQRDGLRKSLFYNFVNEGDPVTRADKAYVKSLLELFAAPPPPTSSHDNSTKLLPLASTPTKPKPKPSKSLLAPRPSQALVKYDPTVNAPGPVWRVPACTLSNAGKIIVLRSANRNTKVNRPKTANEHLKEGVTAQVASDEILRGVIWGDPVCHLMKLYAARIEALAVAAVTVKRH